MKFTPAFAILAVVMYVCGLGDDTRQADAPPSNAAAAKSSPAKPYKDALTAELLKMEEEMTQAAKDGDITLLAKYTTDDFKLVGVDGKIQNKNEALADVKKEKNIKAFMITDGELLSFTEDTAVLAYTQNITLKTGQSGKARVTDTFVKKDGRWLIKSEQATMIKK